MRAGIFDNYVHIWWCGSPVNEMYLQMPLQICVLIGGSPLQSGATRPDTQTSTISQFQMGPLEVVRKALRQLELSLWYLRVKCILCGWGDDVFQLRFKHGC